MAHYDTRPFWIPAGTNKDDLECPIQLKVHTSHGLLADSVDTSLASLLCIVVKQMRCSVKCTRSVSEPRKTCVADALSLCGS